MRFPSFFWVLSTATTVFCLSCGGGGSTGQTSSGSNGNGSGSGTTAGLDGAWDITAAGDGNIGPSEMTIANGVVTGVITSAGEGKTSGDCTKLKDRAEFKLTFEGNALSGTITEIREYEGGDTCPGNKNEITPITGSRTNAGSGLTGEWEVKVGDDPAFIVDIDGLTAKAWDKKAKADGDEATVNASVAGGNATVSATRDELSFAARKR